MRLIDPGPKLTLIKGAAWSLGTRWGIRIIGFLNTMIMARLVLPEDYGIVAMSFLVVALIQSLLDFSSATALLRKDIVSRAEVDSAWTLRGIQGVVMAVAMLVIIPLAELYFQDTRVSTILYVFAACVAVSGFSNIGMILAQKAFNFSLEFRLQLYAKSVSVMLTIAAGWWFRDYRALVIGIGSGYIGGFILSYIMHSYRPRLCVSEIAGIWKITKWLMVANVGGFILRKGDELVGARIGSASDFGLYNVGSDLGQMPTGEVGPAVLKAFLPVLASMTGSTADINSAVLKTIRVVACITLPLGFGMSAVSEPMTLYVLGPNWTDASSFVAVFAIVGAIYSLNGPVWSLMTLRGRTKGLSSAVWVEFGVFAICALALVPFYALMGLVWSRLIGVTVNLCVIYWLGAQICNLSLRESLFAIARPLLGSILMYLAVNLFLAHFGIGIVPLVAAVLFSIVGFSIWCYFGWIIFGRPEGLESTLFEVLGKVSSSRK